MSTVAKLGSAFQLVIFGLINLCVIVMREGQLTYYRPGFRSPFYPWVQIAGMIIPVWLISEMGWFPSFMSVVLVILCIAWYHFFARGRVERYGADGNGYSMYVRDPEGNVVELKSSAGAAGASSGTGA